MAIIRWDPWAIRPWSNWPRLTEDWDLSDWVEPSRGLKIRETEKSIIAEAVVAGVPAEDVEVSIENGVLCVKAEAEEKEIKKKASRYTNYSYYYTAALSGGQWDKTKAEIEDGVVTVTIPKTVSKPKKLKLPAKRKRLKKLLVTFKSLHWRDFAFVRLEW